MLDADVSGGIDGVPVRRDADFVGDGGLGYYEEFVCAGERGAERGEVGEVSAADVEVEGLIGRGDFEGL